MDLNLNIRIMLVEDAGVMRKMERKTLEILGYTNIIEAVSGDQAISFLDAGETVNLIISDWNMPGIDGYEFLLWVRRQPKHKNIPFLMATGRGEKKEAAKAAEAGVSSFISKPFNPEELRIKIEEAFGVAGSKKDKPKAQYSVQTLPNGKIRLKIAHIQITDHLSLGVLKHLISSGEISPKHYELETVCMSGWNRVAESLESSEVDGAFILAPLAMDLYNYGLAIKMILYAHKNGSICVRNKSAGDFKKPYENFFKGKSFFIPHSMSIHNMLAHIFFNANKIKPGVSGDEDVDVTFEVVAPVKMPEFIKDNRDCCGYMVAEPLGTKAIAAGDADLQFLSSEIWENHPCCVVAVNEELTFNHREAITELTAHLVFAGRYIEQKPGNAAEIAIAFLDPQKALGLKVPVLKNVLTEPGGIKTDDLFPIKEDLEIIQNYMHNKMGVGNIIDLDDFIDIKFAEQVYSGIKNRTVRKSNLLNADAIAAKLLKQGTINDIEHKEKALLNKEGKYLMFALGEQDYGVDILKIVEISRMTKLLTIPNAPSYLLGLLNFRGKIIPIIDSVQILNISSSSEYHFIIIAESESIQGYERTGFAVDNVSEILNVKSENIEETPAAINFSGADYVLATAKINEQVKILLKIEKLLDPRERKHL